MIIESFYNRVKHDLLTFMLPQIAFVMTYFFVDALTASFVLMVLACVSYVIMTLRENGAFLLNMFAKLVMSASAAASVWFSDPAYVKCWISAFALLAIMLVLTAKVINRNILMRCTDNTIDMTDKAMRIFLVEHFVIFALMLVIAELARIYMSMGSWMIFQMFFPSMYIWLSMIVALLSIRDKVKIQGERLDHFLQAIIDRNNEMR